mmetsp:Transcript_10393/g.34401  ORF Transcript_10393/g.34401 Transcript_10393/m.34401 type:complete len:266 (-) Transcript_10393:2427-3224(-)
MKRIPSRRPCLRMLRHKRHRQPSGAKPRRGTAGSILMIRTRPRSGLALMTRRKRGRLASRAFQRWPPLRSAACRRSRRRSGASREPAPTTTRRRRLRRRKIFPPTTTQTQRRSSSSSASRSSSSASSTSCKCPTTRWTRSSTSLAGPITWRSSRAARAASCATCTARRSTLSATTESSTPTLAGRCAWRKSISRRSPPLCRERSWSPSSPKPPLRASRCRRIAASPTLASACISLLSCRGPLTSAFSSAGGRTGRTKCKAPSISS